MTKVNRKYKKDFEKNRKKMLTKERYCSKIKQFSPIKKKSKSFSKKFEKSVDKEERMM